jgi:hypothetical protein
MKYCAHCGGEVAEEAVICPKCGCAVAAAEPDIPSTGMNILCFFFPVVGLILYLVWKDKTPLKAKGVGKWAIIGACVSVALGILSSVLSVGLMMLTSLACL